MSDTKTFAFPFGAKVRDKVTGFEGIVTSRGDHISGCDTYAVQNQTLKDGAPQDVKWFDEPRLVLIEGQNVLIVDARAERTGADSVIPSAARAIGR